MPEKISAQVGDKQVTIETGKVADLVLFTGDPLDPMSQLRLMLIDGRTTHANE